MKLKQLVRKLQKEMKNGNGNLDVRMFAHDHDDYKYDEGTGIVDTVSVITNNADETFISLHA